MAVVLGLKEAEAICLGAWVGFDGPVGAALGSGIEAPQIAPRRSEGDVAMNEVQYFWDTKEREE